MATIDPTQLSQAISRTPAPAPRYVMSDSLTTTKRCRAILERNKGAWITLRDVLNSIQKNVSAAEVSSALTKLVEIKFAKTKKIHNGVRQVNAYRLNDAG